MPRYTQFKLQPKSSIHAEVINILVNSRWRPGAILDFHYFAYFITFSKFCYAKVYSIQISAKNLNPRGSYKHFSKFKNAAGRHLGVSKFRIFYEIFQFLLCQGIFNPNFSKTLNPRVSFFITF